MPESRRVSIEGSVWGTAVKDLSNGSTFTVTPDDAKELGIKVVNIAHTGDVDIIQAATTNSGEAAVTLDSLTGEGVSQGNEILVSDESQTELRISNTSGGDIDVIVSGFEVSR